MLSTQEDFPDMFASANPSTFGPIQQPRPFDATQATQTPTQRLAARGVKVSQAKDSGLTSPVPKRPSSLKVLDLHSFLDKEIPPRRHLLYPILPEQGLVMLFAERGVGKTFTALHMAYAVACGGTVFNWYAEQPRPVLYIDGEMPAVTMQQRLASIVASSEENAPDGYFKVLTPDLQGDLLMPNLATEEGQEAIEPHLEGVKLVVVDNLATLCRHGRSNDEESWKPVQDWVLGLRRRGISVLLVHHASKSGAQRGTSAKEDILDTVIQLRRPNDYETGEGARFEVHLTKARGIVGEDAEPFEARLSIHEGLSIWEIKSLELGQVERIRELAPNMSQRDLCEELGLSKGKISRLCKKYGIATKGGNR